MNPLADLKKQSEGISTKKKLSVLPNSYSLALICAISCAHVAHHLAETYGVQSAGIFGEIRVDLSYGMIQMHSVEVIASLVLGLVVMKAQNLLQSSSRMRKKNQNSILPNCYSILLICAIFCAHAAHNLRISYGVQGTADQSCVDNANDSASISKVFPAAVLGLLALSLVVVTAQNLMHSYSSIDRKHQHSVLPKFPSLLLVCSIMCTHVVYNMRDATGTLSTSSLPDTNDMDPLDGMIKIFALAVIGSVTVLFVVVVQTVVRQSNSVDNKGKKSVLPNAYSVVIICGIFCAHVLHHFASVYSVEGPTAKYMISALPLKGIVEMFPPIGLLLFSVAVMALRMRSNIANTTKKVSVLPNLWSIMLICWVLCFHVIHNLPGHTSIASPDARVGTISGAKVGTILGASSAMQRFGHKELGVENIPAEVLYSIPESGVGAGSTGVSNASPKALFASVLFAFIGMTLKMGHNSNGKKGKKSLLPNSRSMLLVCCIFFGHVVHNWPGSAIEYSSQVSAYTGADEVASWDESGPVLPDTVEDLDNLLEVSPDLLTSR